MPGIEVAFTPALEDALLDSLGKRKPGSRGTNEEICERVVQNLQNVIQVKPDGSMSAHIDTRFTVHSEELQESGDTISVTYKLPDGTVGNFSFRRELLQFLQ